LLESYNIKLAVGFGVYKGFHFNPKVASQGNIKKSKQLYSHSYIDSVIYYFQQFRNTIELKKKLIL